MFKHSKRYKKLLILLFLTVGFNELTFSQLKMINSNGYTGLGMIPSANVLDSGKTAFAYENQVPGHLNGRGFNYNVGFGVMDNLEASARLATDDQHCNEFLTGNCPTGHIRDFSTSAKYQIPNKWLPINDKNLTFAIGLNDFGGAASNFSSKYAVATKKIDQFQITLGGAKSSSPKAMLHGIFGGVQWNPTPWAQVSYDQVAKNAWLHSSLYTHALDDSRYDFYLTLHNRLNTSTLTEKSWIGFGVNVPLSDIKEMKEIKETKARIVKLPKIKRFDFQDELQKNGFSRAKLGSKDGTVYLWVDQENYPWNAMDAAGVALGLMASTFGDTSLAFNLVVANRGVDVIGVSGLLSCIRKWFEADDTCASSIEVKSMSHHYLDLQGIEWEFDTTQLIRPELILSPTLINALGTEYGVFDIDVGANINPVVQLWKGAFFDVNYVQPLGIRTQNFNLGGPFYGSRIAELTSRAMLHQTAKIDKVNSQVMFSGGTIYKNWSGWAFESDTTSSDGKSRLDLQTGKFSSSKDLFLDNHKNYRLASYRYTADNRLNTSTEFLAGKFWGGDTGYNVSQRFWHGDNALNFYIKRTRLSINDPVISFAGFQINIPLTPRTNSSFDLLNIRGTAQFNYSAESKILSTDNKITTAMNVIPNTGDTLMLLSNRDRTSDFYYSMRRERLRQAYLELRVQNRKGWVYD